MTPTAPSTKMVAGASGQQPAALARQFLDAVARIEQSLAMRYHINAKGLGDVIREVEYRDRIVRANRGALRVFVTLRNALSHTDWQQGRPIAAPFPETVLAAQQIADELEHPRKALDLATRSPLVAQGSDRLQEVLRTMCRDDISQVPVCNAGGPPRLLTTNAIARWVASHMDADGSVLVEAGTVEDALSCAEGHERLRLVSRTTTAAQALDLLLGGSPPTAVLITQSGRESESALGILVAADVPALIDAVTYSH